MHGKNYRVRVTHRNRWDKECTYGTGFEGVVVYVKCKHGGTEPDWSYNRYEGYMYEVNCNTCGSTRPWPEVLAACIDGKNIDDVCRLFIGEAKRFTDIAELSSCQAETAEQVLKEIKARLGLLVDIGLMYLSLSRGTSTLSGGEAQCIRFATRIGAGLADVLYVLDEPLTGLHQRDNERLITTLTRLRGIDNTLIIIEYGGDTIRTVDWVVDTDPDTGALGGEAAYSGPGVGLSACEDSTTGQYFAGRRRVEVPNERRRVNPGRATEVKGARENNLKGIDVSFSLSVVTAAMGVSGSSKSTPVNQILHESPACTLNRAQTVLGRHKSITGAGGPDRVVHVDQSPIGRMPRSNPAMHTGVWDKTCALFMQTAEAKVRGYGPGRFSFNVKGGRRETRRGDGTIKTEMNSLPNVCAPCRVCNGARYNRETLEVAYNGKNVSDVFTMTIAEAAVFLKPISAIQRYLQALGRVGFGYIKLGQSITTLSGGGAQCVKLASELYRRSGDKTVYILNELTTGLHFKDARKLLQVFQSLTDKGNTVIAIEHNFSVVKGADWVIDMGPEGSNGGGYVIAGNTPEGVAKVEGSHTDWFLAPMLECQMANPCQYGSKQGAIPTQLGVYRFLDGEGRVLYVGRAKNLRARPSSYFQNPAGLSDCIRTMVYMVEAMKRVIVGSEVGALTLEYLWIKGFTSTFSVVLRGNKSYPYLVVSLDEEYPRVWVTRQEYRKGMRYLGPYTRMWAMREILDQLLSVFPACSCTKGQFNQARRLGRPCLFGHIGEYGAPCVERVMPGEHRGMAVSLIRFMESGGSKAIATHRKRVLKAASAEECETAVGLYDEISTLEVVNGRNVIVLNKNLDVNILGIAFDKIKAPVQVFYVRGSRIHGQQTWISDEIGGLELSEVVSSLVLQVYGDMKFDEVVAVPEAPRSVDDCAHTPFGAILSEIQVPGLPEDMLELQKWLAERGGGMVRLKTPRRGDRVKLAHTVRLNAEQALARYRLTRVGDVTVRFRALEELRDAPELDRASPQIERYGASHTQGTHQVVLMVVFESGLAKRADYRHFIMCGSDGESTADDMAAISGVLRRRLARSLAGAVDDDIGAAEDKNRGDHANAFDEIETPRETGNACKTERVPEAERSFETGQTPKACDAAMGVGDVEGVIGAGDTEDTTPDEDETGGGVPRVAGRPSTPRRFACEPGLIVADGGLLQINAAQRVVEETGADARIAGLARGLGEAWIPGEDFPVVLPRRSPLLRLLQQLRDESHRFATTLHRKKRAKAMAWSALDTVPGLGAAKQKALLGPLGSSAKIKAASQEELPKVPGVGPVLARAIVEYFVDAG